MSLNRKCKQCGEEYPLTKEFFYKNSKSKDGFLLLCKPCYKIKDKTYRYNNKQRLRETKLKQRYGITIEDWHEMFEKRNGCCWICGKHQTVLDRVLSVDHNHTTGKVRGLVCNDCNIGLRFLDNEVFMKNANKYLGENKNG